MLYTSPYGTSLYDAYVAILEFTISISVALSVLISIDRLFLIVKYVLLKLKARLLNKRPESCFHCLPFPDLQQFPERYPKVAVQLPMFNERSVCQSIVDHSCALVWPADRLTIQVWMTKRQT